MFSNVSIKPSSKLVRAATAVLLTVAAVSASVSAAPIDNLKDGLTGKIEFASQSTPNLFMYARLNKTKDVAVTVQGELLMPKNVAAGAKVPALVLSHGSSGLSPYAYEVWATKMNAAGVAVFVFDSFKARGVSETAQDQSLVSPASQVADALNALKLVATHPQIDASRIYNIGFSRGGSTAFYTAWPMYQAPINTNGAKFAGHIPVYPGSCNIRYRADDGVKATAPMFFAMADRGREDWQDNVVCERYIKELVAAGNDIVIKEYKGTHHGWDGRAPFFYYNNANTSKQCDMELQMTNTQGSGVGRNAKDIKNNTEIKSLEDWDKAVKHCMTHSRARVGGDRSASDELVADVLKFIGHK